MSNYFNDPRLNASTLKCFAGRDYSPAVALQKLQGPKKQTKALTLGTLVHAFVEGLGSLPEGTILKERDEDVQSSSEFILSPFEDFRKADAKAWKADILKTNPNLVPVKPSEIAQAQAMAKSLLDKVDEPYKGILHSDKSLREAEFYTDTHKAKLDLVSKSRLIGCEIKTTRGTTWEEIKRDFDRMFYHLQCALYADISGVKSFGALIVSNVEPYPVFQAPCTDAYLEFGRWELARAAERFEIWKETEASAVPVADKLLDAPEWWKDSER